MYYVTWCTDFGGPALGLARTTDFVTFVRMENLCTPYSRNGVLFPRKIDGEFVLLTRPSDAGHTSFGDIFISQSPDLEHWGHHRRVMSAGDTWWQALKIGAGADRERLPPGVARAHHAAVVTPVLEVRALRDEDVTERRVAGVRRAREQHELAVDLAREEHAVAA